MSTFSPFEKNLYMESHIRPKRKRKSTNINPVPTQGCFLIILYILGGVKNSVSLLSSWGVDKFRKIKPHAHRGRQGDC